ncbi:MAG: chemotaxis protein CheX [Alphaproteobacteria bacterium]|nr:chemotaxis protein CheX [Alphaproteobacteria bacterium]MBV8549221.1 chemotaxis protein CheX [Alphaproteobacteria bacterium]
MSGQPFALNETLAREISQAVCKVMHETFMVDVVPGPYEIGDGMVSLVGDVSGVIAIVQSQLEGTMTMCMGYETVRSLLPQVVGKAVTITHEMAVDAVGEMTNMVFGQVKRDMGARGYQIKLGIPSVVTGKGHFVSQFHRGKYMIVPFHINGQLFQIYVALHDALRS